MCNSRDVTYGNYSFVRLLLRGILLSSILTIICTANVVEALSNQRAPTWQQQASLIDTQLDSALAAVREGRSEDARQLAEDAYFVLFEGVERNMEVAIRMNISGRRCYELESQFTEFRQGITQGMEVAMLEAAKQQLVADLVNTAHELDAETGTDKPLVVGGTSNKILTVSSAATFGKSLVIILREGIEIILIIGAISAFLIKAGQRSRLKVVVSGVVAGLVASILTAIGSSMFISSLDVNPEIIEGMTMMIAAVVLFFVSHWLISKAESKKWIDFIRSKTNVSLNSGNMTALWMVAFLAVYREGAETILFYQGLSSMAPSQGNAILAGLISGCLALGVLFLIFRQGILRIPPRPFFRITSGLLYYMAFVFAGKAIVELQAGEVLRAIRLDGWPTIDFLGVYPTIQSMTVQGCFIAAILGSLLFVILRRARESSARLTVG